MRSDLAMAIHFHQPVGNFDEVMERACDKCYIPFIELLKIYPEIKMSFHFTGCLLEWAEKKRPELAGMIKEMASSGQIEVMTGGFYEPILPSIPARDRVRQIKMLSEYVRKNFGYEPVGAWIAERVWEPDLPSVLSDAGVKYVMLDDTHFLYAGIDKDKTYGYYVTEDNGKSVAVLPTDKTLRYQIPFKMPEECMDYLKHVRSWCRDPLFVYGDDGEKFGEWPGTHDWVFGQKWLEKFFDALMENSDWLRTVTVAESIKRRAPKGRVYLPTSSYEEMLQWALPADRQEYMENVVNDIRYLGKEDFYKPFIRGGFWRNFLTKYPESNDMNKKMVHISNKVNELRGAKVDPEKLKEAEVELFRGQCNCAYWHGEFGGLYLFHLRRSLYHHLIKSEVILDSLTHGDKDFCLSEIADTDGNGRDEVILSNKELSLCFAPAEGGMLKELDSKKIAQNLINSLSRRKEAYHRKIREKLKEKETEEAKTGEVQTIHDGIKEVGEGIEDNLSYDWYDRRSFLDHFLAKDVKIDQFARCEYHEIGDFVKGEYAFDVKESKGKVLLAMKKEGFVDGKNIVLEKSVELQETGSTFNVLYKISNPGKGKIDFTFGSEFNLTMPDADADKYSIVFSEAKKNHKLGSKSSANSSKGVTVSDSSSSISFEMNFSEPMKVWCFPVKTVSQSEKAYELNYQSSAIFPHMKVSLKGGGSKEFSLNVKIVS